MNSSKSMLSRNNNTSQDQGVNTVAYPTSFINPSVRGSFDGSSISEDNKIQLPAKTERKKQGYFKRLRRLGTLTTSYFGRLFKRKGAKNERSSAIEDTAYANIKSRSSCWKTKLQYQRNKPYNAQAKEPMKPRGFIWCFRPIGTAAAFKSPPNKSLKWVEFEKKNQIEISRQLSLLKDRDVATQGSFEIQDKNIFSGTVVVTVMLKEQMAFVLDPEWSQPITYAVNVKPKFRWYEEIYMRHKYRQMLRDQHKALKSSTFP